MGHIVWTFLIWKNEIFLGNEAKTFSISLDTQVVSPGQYKETRLPNLDLNPLKKFHIGNILL